MLTMFSVFLLFAAAATATQIKLLADDGARGHEFGQAVSVSGNYAIVGAYKNNERGTDSGSAYIFRYDGANWIQEAKLKADDQVSHDYFGYSVSISEQDSECYAVVGAFNNHGNSFGTGSAYVFRRDGTEWIQEAKLTAGDGSRNDYFGYSVSISGSDVIVGAYRDDDSGDESGSACMFKRNGTTWTEQSKLTPDDGAAGDNFGRSVSVSGDYAVVGAIYDDDRGSNSGTAYVFKRNGDAWIQQTKLTSDDGEKDDFFGFSVSVSGDYVIVGADADDDKGGNSGSAYIFKRDGSQWTQEAKLTASDGASGDFLGRSVSISGDYVIVGADADDDKGGNSGSAYIFRRDGSAWIQETKLTAGDGSAEDNFGWSVSVFAKSPGYYAITGANTDDDNGNASGSAYIYDSFSDGNSSPNILIDPDSLRIRKFQYEQAKTRKSETELSGMPNTSSPVHREEADEECAKGLIIPEDVQRFWRTYTPPPRKPSASGSLKPSVDWSEYDSPVRSQKSCGSCWAFAAIALVENLGNQANLLAEQDLSEQELVSCSVGDCNGGWYWDALNYIRKTGIAPESCYTYKSESGDCSEKCVSPDFLQKINEFTPSPGLWGENHTVDDLREALQTGPLSVAMRVPDDGSFSGSGYTGGVYDYDGDFIRWDGNGHAVLLVGYDDAEQSFKVKNSWGASWGENGYFRIAYNDVTDDVKFGSYACKASGVYIEQENAMFTITNSGAGELIIYNISDNKSWLTVSPETVLPIPAGGHQVMTVSVTDWNAVSLVGETGIITLSSNDPDESSVFVEVNASPSSIQFSMPVLQVSPPFREVYEAAGTFRVDISNAGKGTMDWTVETDEYWLVIENESFGTDDGSVTVNYEANGGPPRTGIITVEAATAGNSPQMLEIRQSGIPLTVDIDDSGSADLVDAILALKVAAGTEVAHGMIRSDFAASDADVGGDGKIGLEEAIRILNYLSKAR